MSEFKRYFCENNKDRHSTSVYVPKIKAKAYSPLCETCDERMTEDLSENAGHGGDVLTQQFKDYEATYRKIL